MVATLGTAPEVSRNPVLIRGRTYNHGGIDHSMSVKKVPSGDTPHDRQSKKSGARSRRRRAKDPEEESGPPDLNGSGSPESNANYRRLASGYSEVSKVDSMTTYASDADEPTGYKFVTPRRSPSSPGTPGEEGPPEPNKSPRRPRKVPPKKPSKWSKMKSTIANKLNLPGGPPAVTQLKKAPTLPKRSPTLRSQSSVVSESFFLGRILPNNPSLRDPAKEEPETQVGMEPAPLPDPVEVPVFEWYDLQTIRYDGGDVLICQRWDFEVSRRIFFLFAINRYEVIYVYRPSTYHSLARIEVDRTLNLYEGLEHYIDTSNCKNLGNKGSNIKDTIKRAMHWREYYVFYDSDGCWGYHWVMYWATGTPPKPRVKNSLIAGFDTPMHENCRLNTITKRPYPDPKRAHRRDMKLHMKKTKLSWRNYLYEWYWVDGQSISP